MDKIYDIAVIPGDGTGPEVIDEGVKVLTSAARKYGFGIDFADPSKMDRFEKSPL